MNKELELLDQIEEIRQKAVENPEKYPVHAGNTGRTGVWQRNRNAEICGGFPPPRLFFIGEYQTRLRW